MVYATDNCLKGVSQPFQTPVTILNPLPLRRQTSAVEGSFKKFLFSQLAVVSGLKLQKRLIGGFASTSSSVLSAGSGHCP